MTYDATDPALSCFSLFGSQNSFIMGVLKLSILDEQNKKYKAKMKIAAKGGKSYHVGNCSCPCECFIKEGEVIMSDDIASTASWNID